MIRLQQAVNDMKFLSTLSLRRATGGYGCAYLYLIISIHALLAESDGMTEFIGALFDISIHALLAESDLPVFLSGFWAYLFLSTLSLRRATRLFLEIYTLFKNFYPRSPCGERRVVHVAQDPSPGRISIHALLAESDPAGNGGSGSITAISIHALLAESDTKDKKYKIKKAIFLSTLSLRRATSA